MYKLYILYLKQNSVGQPYRVHIIKVCTDIRLCLLL